MMTTTLRIWPIALALGLLLPATAPAAPLPTISDEQVKERLLKLNELTTEIAANERLRELAKDKPLAKRLVAMGAKMHADAKPKEKPFKFNASLVLGKLAQGQKDYKTAKVFYEYCEEDASKLDSESKLAFAMEALIDLSWEQKDFEAVIARCQKVLQAEPEGMELRGLQNYALEKLVQSTARSGKTEEALAMIDKLPFRKWYSSQLRSYVYREADKTQEAIDELEESQKSLEDEDGLTDEQKTRLKRNAKYMTTNLYVDLKKIDKAAEILEGLIKDDPENPTYPNDLGFVWCDNDLKIDESEKLIRKALELDEKMRKKLLDDKKIDAETAKKRTSAYLDSLGWVLYKKKDYKEAVKYLLEASEDEEEAQHIEIWDHLADCYLAMGDTAKAIETWTKALKFEDISKRDAERRKKVTAKLQKAKAATKKDEKPAEKDKN